MKELLKQGDFVVAYDQSCFLVKGIVIQDEIEGNTVLVAVIKYGGVYQEYYNRNCIEKV